MFNLNRIQVGKFNIDDAINIGKFINNNEELLSIITDKIVKIENLFEEKDKIELNDRKLELFLNGVKLTQNSKNEIYRIYNKNKFIGIGIVENELLKRDIVI